MADWSHMLMFAESMNTDEDADPKSMKSLEEFSAKAANHRTPKKISENKTIEREVYAKHDARKEKGDYGLA